MKQKVYTFSRLGTYGALGNQLWQIAGTIGEADKNRALAMFPPWEYKRYFAINDWYFPDNYEEIIQSSDYEVVDLYPDYLQALYHFDHIFQTVRRLFQPEKSVAKYIDTLFDDFYLPVTAVHVRRANNLGLPDHHPVPTVGYFQKALALTPKNNHLYVFSDDLEWCKQQEIFQGAKFGLGPPPLINVMDLTGDRPLTIESAAYDLLTMAQCQTHVISNSTFSWWSAWLADSRKVVYPGSRWFGSALSHINTSVMFPRDWISL